MLEGEGVAVCMHTGRDRWVSANKSSSVHLQPLKNSTMRGEIFQVRGSSALLGAKESKKILLSCCNSSGSRLDKSVKLFAADETTVDSAQATSVVVGMEGFCIQRIEAIDASSPRA